ncbi:MAG TPA: hypothetical protein VNO26_10320 [Candidatus Limnocylindria bacterium]|nr:hypothetical protein [Candidatus Limnocylindria bacterium]
MLVTLRRLLDVLRALARPPRGCTLAPSRVCHAGTPVAYRRMRFRRTRRTRGASLIDVLVGLAITAVLFGIAVPTIPALMDPYRLSFAARVVASQLSAARMKSIAQNRRHRLNFNQAAGTYQMEVETAPNVWAPAAGLQELPSGCNFGTIAGPPTFDTRGMLAQNFDIPVYSAEQTKTVKANILGNIQIETGSITNANDA